MTKLRTYYAQHYDDIMLLSLYCHNLGGLAQLTNIRVACTINEIYNPENNPYMVAHLTSVRSDNIPDTHNDRAFESRWIRLLIQDHIATSTTTIPVVPIH